MTPKVRIEKSYHPCGHRGRALSGAPLKRQSCIAAIFQNLREPTNLVPNIYLPRRDPNRSLEFSHGKNVMGQEC
jgi:hypothetical protein